MSTITSTNRMSAKALISSENAELEFITNPHTGKLFFSCGTKQGYVSPALKDIYESATLDEMQYAEVSLDGKPAVPCLMTIGNSKKNVKRTLGAELLR